MNVTKQSQEAFAKKVYRDSGEVYATPSYSGYIKARIKVEGVNCVFNNGETNYPVRVVGLQGYRTDVEAFVKPDGSIECDDSDFASAVVEVIHAVEVKEQRREKAQQRRRAKLHANNYSSKV